MGMFGSVTVHNVFVRKLQPETQHNFCCSHTGTPDLNFRAPGLSRKNFSGGPDI